MVDEAGYAQIVRQVRDKEFQNELKQREKELKQKQEGELKLAQMEQKAEFDKALQEKETELSGKEKEIEKLVAKLSGSEMEKQLAVKEAVQEKEKEIAEKIEEMSQLKEKFSAGERGKDQLIAELKAQISGKETEKRLAVSEAVNGKEKEREEALEKKNKELAEKLRMIEELKAKLEKGETEKRLAVSEAIQGKEKEISEKAAEIIELQGKLSNKAAENELKEQALQRQYEDKLKLKDEQIEYYKDFKARQSTKMIGESLEQHCLNQFNALRMTAFPAAYFEKDNDAKTGSKGDFIFREAAEGVEFISIMFEMKNEMDETSTKHKNEDFFKELDKDRREKKGEYEVLVSLLEIDNELYNNGIVDVSYKYEKMYVIRPQFFIPMITLLRNAALNSLQYRQELEAAKHQQVDILHFEENMNAFKEGFARNYRIASDKFKTAIDEIDKTITHLQKTKEALLSSENNLRLANNKAEDLSIKRLTKNAPAVKEMFDGLERV